MGNKNVQQGLGGRSRRCTIIPVSFLERDSLLTRERGGERGGERGREKGERKGERERGGALPRKCAQTLYCLFVP